MINILNKFNMSPDMLLFTLDITSLYTNIPHNEHIQSINEFLAIYRHTNTLPHNSYIVELLEVVLTNNYFDFNGKHYHQLSGTAVSTKLAASYANLFMTKFEENHVYAYHLQCKENIDRHMYLNFNSEHPMRLKRFIPYSQFLRLPENIL